MSILIGGPAPDQRTKALKSMANGGVLSVGTPSEISSSMSVFFPLATAVATDGYIEVFLPESGKGTKEQKKTLMCQSTNTITDVIPAIDPAETSIEIDGDVVGVLRFISDGVSQWRY